MNIQSLTWDVARTGGLVAYALLTASVAIGLTLSLGWRSPRWTRFVTNELHRFVTLLALVFVVVHGVAIAVDPFIKMSLGDILVPFLTSYRPAWVALGIIAGYLALAVYLSERVRGRVGYAWWRRFHALAFVAFVFALVHGIATGSDTRTPWALGLYFGSLGLVGFLLVLRLLPEPPKRPRPVAVGLATVIAVGVVGFTFAGPLQAGWSTRAGGTVPTGTTTSSGSAATGTAGAPAGSGATAGSGTTGGAAPSAAPAGIGVAMSQALPFDGQIGRQGRAIQVQGETRDGTAAFLVQLTGDGGGVAGSVAGRVVVNTGTDQVCQGDVGTVGDTTIDATCSVAGGATFSLRIAVTEATQTQISGTLELTPAAGAARQAPAGADRA